MTDPNVVPAVSVPLMGLLSSIPMIATNVAYIWSRAKAKATPDAKPGYKTTEFWMNAMITLVTLASQILGVKLG